MKHTVETTLIVVLGLFCSIIVSVIVWPNEFNSIQNSFAAKYQRRVMPNVLGLSVDESKDSTEKLLSQKNFIIKAANPPAALMVPTDGIAANQGYLFSATKHPGIDIWTLSTGKGFSGSKGSAVYAACSGRVVRVFIGNAEIELLCDPIDPIYSSMLPSLRVKTVYAHMADAVTKTPYYRVKLGQRVEKGELIGYQGNLSYFAPYNRVTHLHFGIYDMNRSGRPAINPDSFIGVPTTILNQKYSTQIR